MKSLVTTVLLILLVLILFSSSSCRSLPTDPDQEAPAPVALAGHPTGPGPVTYIVLTSQPPNKEDKIHFYLRILTRVFGSEEAAKNALVYTYTHAITGFAAILTTDQLAKLSEQPEVLTVFKNEAVDIDQAVSAQASHARDLTAPALYIVLTSEPPKQEDRNQFYLRVLIRVFDHSDEAAKNALLISYKHAIAGFAAKLTPDQVSRLLEQPEVLTVIKDEAF